MAREFASELNRFIEELIKTGRAADSALLIEVAARVSRGFGVQPDEVAILGLNAKRRFLYFLVPEKLQNVGSIPMTSTNALAVRTARDRRPEVINNFSAARHVSFFEAVQLTEEPADPIQKIMSAPIGVGGKVFGVIQVSRKGKNLTSAGPDFTQKELGLLVLIANQLGPCLQLCVPA